MYELIIEYLDGNFKIRHDRFVYSGKKEMYHDTLVKHLVKLFNLDENQIKGYLMYWLTETYKGNEDFNLHVFFSTDEPKSIYDDRVIFTHEAINNYFRNNVLGTPEITQADDMVMAMSMRLRMGIGVQAPPVVVPVVLPICFP